MPVKRTLLGLCACVVVYRASVDKDHDGKISKAEFCTAMTMIRQAQSTRLKSSLPSASVSIGNSNTPPVELIPALSCFFPPSFASSFDTIQPLGYFLANVVLGGLTGWGGGVDWVLTGWGRGCQGGVFDIDRCIRQP